MRLTHKKITSHLLSLIVQRQPTKLILDWSILGKQQLTWLLPRIPQTRKMSLCGLEYNSSVVALNTANCPMLQELDLSYVTNFNDTALYKLLSSPKDSRPGKELAYYKLRSYLHDTINFYLGLLDKKSRLKMLRILNLSGTEISDVGLRYVTQYLVQLESLSVAGCWKVSDAGLAQLSMNEARTVETLRRLDLSNCKGVTDAGLVHLIRCRSLSYVNCANSTINQEAMQKFVEESSEKLKCVGFVIQKGDH